MMMAGRTLVYLPDFHNKTTAKNYQSTIYKGDILQGGMENLLLWRIHSLYTFKHTCSDSILATTVQSYICTGKLQNFSSRYETHAVRVAFEQFSPPQSVDRR